MPISFLQVPVGIKVPGVYTEIDSSKAQQGVSIKPYNCLLIGQKLTDGSKPAGQIDSITSSSQARSFYGKGSQLFHMVDTFISQNAGLNSLKAIAVAEGASVKAAASYSLTGPATAAGVLSLMVAGRRYRVAVDSGDTAIEVTTALIAAIQADEDRLVDAVVDGVDAFKTNLTARNGGEWSSELDIRENYFDGEELPAGLASTIVAFSGGAGNPDIAPVIAAMGETQYDMIVMPYTDTSNLDALKVELDSRWGPLRPIDGHLVACKKQNFAAHETFLDGRNSEHETIMNIAGPTPSFQWAANLAARIVASAQIDPARPFQTLALDHVLAPSDVELFDLTERNLILNAGGSTYFVDGGGSVRIERLRTTRIENEFGAPDEALADLNPKLTLSFIRYDVRVLLLTRYPRHKLADDGTRFGAGQAIITPKVGRAEMLDRFEQWEALGLVEGFEQFKRDLIVERNAQDANRLDFLLPPDLINQFRVAGVQIQFLL